MMFGVSSLSACRERALSLLFPETCQFCQQESAKSTDGYVCSQCWKRLRFLRHPFCERCGLPFDGEVFSTFRCTNCRDQKFVFRTARAAVIANEFSLNLVHQYKYEGAVWLEKVLADLLWDQLGVLGMREDWDLVVPVPLFSTKKREREFNQAERIGGIIAARLGVPMEGGLVKRVAPTGSQTMLTRSERRKNVQGAFAVGIRRPLKGLRLMLVDDVFTTGATTNACARVLKKLGATDIQVWTVVRGL